MISTMLIWRLIHFSSQSIFRIIIVLNLRFLSLSSRITTRQIHVQNNSFHFKLHLQLSCKDKFSLCRMRNQLNSLTITSTKHLKIIIKKTMNVLALVINILHDQNATISIWLYNLWMLTRIFKFRRKLTLFLSQIHEWQQQSNWCKIVLKRRRKKRRQKKSQSLIHHSHLLHLPRSHCRSFEAQILIWLLALLVLS